MKIKRLVRKAEATTPEEFIQECEDSGKFNWGQMMYIRQASRLNITMEQLNFISNPNFSKAQMAAIRTAYDYNVPMSIIEQYSKPENSNLDTVFKYYDKLTTEQLDFIAKDCSNACSLYVVELIAEGFEKRLSVEEAKILTNPNLTDRKVQNIINRFLQGSTIEDIKKKYNL
jgi:hypothetical protein